MTQASHSKASHSKVLFASFTGSTIEWFDYFLYGTMSALVFNKLFFPTFDPFVGLMLSYLSFSLTFFIRPFGGAIFSHIGDRIGRKKTLVLSLSLMGGGTFLIGCLPGYDTIGVWAPLALIALRLIQGLGISGEWGGALLLAYEYAPENRKGFYGCIPQIGVPLGMLLATLALSLMSLLPENQFLAWGWRVPFLLSAVLVALGLWIRLGIAETPEFERAKDRSNLVKAPLLDTFRYHWKGVLAAVGLKVIETAPFYLFSTFVVSYATTTLKYEKFNVLSAISIATFVAVITIPFMGMLSDKLGRRTVYSVGAVLMAFFIVPYFMLLDRGTYAAIVLASVLGLGLLYAPIIATVGSLMASLFPTSVRYSGITLGSQIGAAVAGGSAPLIATWLLREGGDWRYIAVYMIACAGISLVCAMGRFDGSSRDAEQGHAEALRVNPPIQT